MTSPDDATPVKLVLPEHPPHVQASYYLAQRGVDDAMQNLTPNECLAVAGLLSGHLERIEERERRASRAARAEGRAS